MALQLKPARGGFLRPFGCGWFIREFLLGNGPYGSPKIDPEVGAPQADIFHHYKMALMKATALDRATRVEEKKARRAALRKKGIEICIEQIQEIREIEGVAGIHIMAVEWEAAVRPIVEGAGLLPRPTVT